MMTADRRRLLLGTGAVGAAIAMPTVLPGAGHGDPLGRAARRHAPQVLMAERAAKEIKEKSAGRLDVQVFPNSQLGSGKDMMEAVSAGALHFTTEGAGALGAFLPQSHPDRGALSLARRSAPRQGRSSAGLQDDE